MYFQPNQGISMFSRKHFVVTAVITITLVMLQGCSTMTRFDGASAGVVLSLPENQNMELPKDLRLKSKATGQYLFKATSSSGQTLYGLLPLHVNGGTMAGSILFFAPTLFIGGFRDVFPFYQLDPDAGLIRFKKKEADEWRLSKPTTAESERAKIFFDRMDIKCASPSKQGHTPSGCADGTIK
jgi:hypothetical protein